MYSMYSPGTGVKSIELALKASKRVGRLCGLLQYDNRKARYGMQSDLQYTKK
jgi:hypothetical protein